MKNAVKIIESLQFKLHMFGVPIDGPINIYFLTTGRSV